MSPAVQLILGFLIAALSYIQQFLWFLFKVFLTAGIGWGILRSLDPFPLEIISRWQGQLQSASFGFLGEEYLRWVANNWLEIAALVVLIVTVRSRDVLSVVGLTSGHAAYAASALANYLDIEPTTPRLLKLQREPTSGFFRAIIKEGLYNGMMSIFGGVPFLPDEAIPGRKGEVASFRQDFRKYLSMAETETAQLDSITGGARPAVPTTTGEFGWDNDHERQELWVQVENWQYKVFVASLKSHSTLFQFEGIASEVEGIASGGSGLKGLRVDGDITIPFELLSGSEEPPPDFRGDFFFSDGIFGPYLKVKIKVAPKTFEELYRVFSGQFASNNGGLGLNLQLKHPKGAEPGFWRAGWQKETIQISHFDFYSGGRFKKYATFA